MCERCARSLTAGERRHGTALCDDCWDTWFKHFKRRALLGFCGVAALLELSMNAAVIAPFQPIAVEHFGWGSDRIAAVNVLSATLSVIVSFGVAQLRLNEWAQVIAASALYVSSTLLFAWPPMEERRLVLGLVLGLKAQILFMAPFTAAFSRLIGGPRVTNGLTTALCLAPLIGAALGTALAPALLPYASTPLFLVTAAPAIVAMLALIAGWRLLASQEAAAAGYQPLCPPSAKSLQPPAGKVVACEGAGDHEGDRGGGRLAGRGGASPPSSSTHALLRLKGRIAAEGRLGASSLPPSPRILPVEDATAAPLQLEEEKEEAWSLEPTGGEQ